MRTIVEYAVFEPVTHQTPLGGGAERVTGVSRFDAIFPLDVSRGSIPSGLPPKISAGYAETVRTVTDPKTASAARDAGAIVLPIPRMPVRLIPQVSEAHDAVPGEPWGVAAVGADRTGDLQGQGVCVAVLDSGIDVNHPAFSGLIREDNYVDFTRNGKEDNLRHGTHCAGIIFGRPIDGRRIAVAPGIQKVLIGKIADVGFETTTSLLQEAMLWAVSNGANIISLSFGLDFIAHFELLQTGGVPPRVAQAQALNDYGDYTRQFDRLMTMVVSAGAAANSALVIAACGNDSRQEDGMRVHATLPAVAENVISVGALGRNGDGSFSVAPFSNSGANLCGPGVDILSAGVGGASATMSGTSQAAPHVAGVAALWMQKLRRERGSLPAPADIRQALLSAAKSNKIAGHDDPDAIGHGLAMAPTV